MLLAHFGEGLGVGEDVRTPVCLGIPGWECRARSASERGARQFEERERQVGSWRLKGGRDCSRVGGGEQRAHVTFKSYGLLSEDVLGVSG